MYKSGGVIRTPVSHYFKDRYMYFVTQTCVSCHELFSGDTKQSVISMPFINFATKFEQKIRNTPNDCIVIIFSHSDIQYTHIKAFFLANEFLNSQ